VLQSPYTSIKDVVKSFAGGLAAAVITNRWNNVEEAKSITDPVLIIHGQKDKIIPYSHSEVRTLSVLCFDLFCFVLS
jgi:pimeloyl-ACP methyl ester carboxylesterase